MLPCCEMAIAHFRSRNSIDIELFRDKRGHLSVAAGTIARRAFCTVLDGAAAVSLWCGRVPARSRTTQCVPSFADVPIGRALLVDGGAMLTSLPAAR